MRSPRPWRTDRTFADLSAVVRLLQGVDVELLHPQHRLHGRVGLLRILVSQHLAQGGGNDLPGQAVLVLEPAAWVFSTGRRQLRPERIDFLLRLTVDEQGYRLRELELRAAVQGVEVLTLELEGAGHDRPLHARPGVSVSRDAHDPRILEDRHIEVHRLFGVAVEPQERDDLLHRALAIDGEAGGTG